MFVTINGNELAVEVFGEEGAPVLIAHHGAPGLGSRAEPRATFAPFADTFRVVVFDARGSGRAVATRRSPTSSGPPTSMGCVSGSGPSRSSW